MHEPSTPTSDRLDRTLAALAHPARRVMLARLAQGRASASELGTLVDVSQPAVSKHLKVLEEAGLISRGRDAQWRPCELRVEALEDVEEWMQGFRRTWSERLGRLDRYVRQVRDEASPAEQGPHPAEQGQGSQPQGQGSQHKARRVQHPQKGAGR